MLKSVLTLVWRREDQRHVRRKSMRNTGLRAQAWILPLVVLYPGEDSLTGPEVLNVTYS